MADKFSAPRIAPALVALWAAISLNGQISTDFRNRAAFAESLRKANETRLFEGLPHEVIDGRLYESELRTKKTVLLHEFHFYSQPLEFKGNDSQTIAALLRDRKSLERFSGPKACGGYHPDYAFEWHVGGATYQALICLGCHEIRFYGPRQELYCDIAEAAYEPLLKLLVRYQQNRPGRLLH